MPGVIQDGVKVFWEDQLPMFHYALRVPMHMMHRLPQLVGGGPMHMMHRLPQLVGTRGGPMHMMHRLPQLVGMGYGEGGACT